MSDYISRQAALDALEKIERMHPYKVYGDTDSYGPYCEGWSDAVCKMEHSLTIQPEAERTIKPTPLETGLQYFEFGTCECGRQVEKPKGSMQRGHYYCPQCGARLDWN